MPRPLLKLGIAVLLAVSTAGAAAPKLPPPVSTPSILSSPNVSLVATIPDVVSVGGRFVGNYFFTTTINGLRIYDVTNPEVPTLLGALPIHTWENEDVDVSASRKLVLLSEDNFTGNEPIGRLLVVSWMNPRLPMIVGMVSYPEYVSYHGNQTGGPGHIANCIADCGRYAYVTGARNGSLFVIDLMDAANPKIAGVIPPSMDPAGVPNKVFKGGAIHNIDIDREGHAWATGSGGTAELDVTNPLHPKPLRWVSPLDRGRTDHFIHHNSLRLDQNTVLVTEEDYPEMCGQYQQLPTIATEHQGTFQAWHIDRTRTGSGALTVLGQWDTELGNYLDGYEAATVACSSHWFTFNSHKIVAVGWYSQGVRFLDVSDPTHIRQIGYWVTPGEEGLGMSAGLFVPGHDDIVYAPDYSRGLDVLKIQNGGVGAGTVSAPVRSEWLAPRALAPSLRFADPSPEWGWACLVPRTDGVE